MTRDLRDPRMMSTEPYVRLLDGAVTTAALVHGTIVTTLPTTGFAYARGEMAKLFFGGTATAGTSAKYMVNLYYAVSQEDRSGNSSAAYCYIPQVVAKGTLLAGTATYGAYGTSMGATSNFLVDSITDTAAFNGTQVVNPTNGFTAFIEVPMQGAVGLEVKVEGVTTGMMKTIDAFLQFGPAPRRTHID